MNLAWVRRHLRPLRVFLIAAVLGLIVGLILRIAFNQVLQALQQALFYRITKPLELIQGPLTGILGTEEAATALYLLANNLFVSFIAAFGGLILVRYTMKRDDEAYSGQSKATNLLHRLIGEGNQTYKEHSVLIYLLPLAVVFVNGAVLGLISADQGANWKEFHIYLAFILPHGVVEIPAVILAAIIGYAHAIRLNRFLEAAQIDDFFRSVDEALRSRRSWGLFSIVIIMIVSAAAIESYVTPIVGHNALRKAYFSLRTLNASVKQGEAAFAVLQAAFGATITFHRDSTSGPEFPVALVGSKGYPFEVEGVVIPDSQIVVSSRLTVPNDVVILLLEFWVEEAGTNLTVFLTAQHGKLEDQANLTVTP